MRLGAVLLGAVLLGGCLVPQEDQILDDVPPRVNRPPRLLGKTMFVNGSLGPLATLEMGDGCGPVSFEASVEDPDLNDRLRYFWFIDYDAAGPLINRRPYDTGILDPTGVEVRTVRKLTLDPGSVENPLQTEGDHVVQLIVTDGLLEISDPPGTEPPPDPVEGVDAGNPRFIDEYAWFVTVDTKPCLTGVGP